MKGLLRDGGDIFDSTTDHFVFSLEVSKERYFGLGKLGHLTHICVRVVTVVNLCQCISKAHFISQHLLFKFRRPNNLLQKISIKLRKWSNI